MSDMYKLSHDDVIAGSALDRGQGGGTFMPFHGSHYLRHAQITSWWERVLAVVSLAMLAFVLVNIVLRNL